jgi:hypothetical protein
VRARTHALTCTLQSCMHVHTTKLHAHAHYKSCMHMHTTKLHAHAHYRVACTGTLQSCMHMHTTKLHAHAHYKSYMHITNDKDRQNYPMFWPLLSGKLKALLSDPQAFVAAKAISKSCNCKHLLNVTNFLPHNHTGSGHSPTN